MKKILIIDTGGTFNKIYNPLTSKLDIPQNNHIIKQIFKKVKISKTGNFGKILGIRHIYVKLIMRHYFVIIRLWN